jgi:hypothetical protein
MRLAGQSVRRVITGMQSALKGRRRLGRRQELHLHDDFHGQDYTIASMSPGWRRNPDISALVGSLKGVSAHYLRKEYADHVRNYLWGDHFWSPSYFAASCGGAPLSAIKDYIDQQNTRSDLRVKTAQKSHSS